MRACLPSGYYRRFCLPLLTLVLQAPLALADDDGGFNTGTFIPPAPWREQAAELPAYPQQDRLLEVAVSSGDYPYRVYVDPESVTVGDDRVVRYAVVVASLAGARNVAYEGLRCSTREYRRYAYGTSGGWQTLDDAPWERIRESGMGQYRFELYRDYLCDTTSDILKRDEILRRLRYSREGVLDE
jgi:hypothetical protein